MGRRWWVVGLAVAALVVIALAPLASSDPDGLERVAADRGFIDQAQGALYEILPGYAIPGVEDGTMSTIAAGLIGMSVIFVLTWGLGVLLTRRRRTLDRDST